MIFCTESSFVAYRYAGHVASFGKKNAYRSIAKDTNYEVLKIVFLLLPLYYVKMFFSLVFLYFSPLYVLCLQDGRRSLTPVSSN